MGNKKGMWSNFIYKSIHEITLKSEADCEQAIWCNIVTRNSTLSSLSKSKLRARRRCKTIKGYKGGEQGGVCYNG